MGAGEVFDRAVWVAESVRKIVVRLALGDGRSDVGSAGAGLGLAVVIAVAAGRLGWRAPVDARLIEPAIQSSVPATGSFCQNISFSDV